jgi:hypothetical protein
MVRLPDAFLEILAVQIAVTEWRIAIIRWLDIAARIAWIIVSFYFIGVDLWPSATTITAEAHIPTASIAAAMLAG